MNNVYRQRDWTELQLRTAGFHYIIRRKQCIMAARLHPSNAPLTIDFEYGSITASAGDVICFEAEDAVQPRILNYSHWSVKPYIFKDTYRRWDEAFWMPTPAQDHLFKHGCRPYYKHKGAWAKRLTRPTYVQTIESSEPDLMPEGTWLLIGETGEPWCIDDETLHNRYIIPV